MNVPGSFCDGLATISVDGREGFIDVCGQIVIEPQFDSANSFSHGFAVVRLRNSGHKERWYINKSGKKVFGPFQNALDFAEDWAAVVKDERTVFIDINGNTVIELPHFVWARRFSEGLAAIKVGTRSALGKSNADLVFGYVDRTGALVIEPIFDEAYAFNQNRAVVVVKERYGVIDSDGTFVVRPQYDFADSVRDSRIRFKKDEFYGFLDGDGNLAIPPCYKVANNFSEGIACVCV